MQPIVSDDDNHNSMNFSNLSGRMYVTCLCVHLLLWFLQNPIRLYMTEQTSSDSFLYAIQRGETCFKYNGSKPAVTPELLALELQEQGGRSGILTLTFAKGARGLVDTGPAAEECA